MIPVTCRIPHKPEEGKYGDCFRACVASILELGANDVPHFSDGDPGGEEMHRLLREFLAPKKLTSVFVGFDASEGFANVMEMFDMMNGHIHAILFCANDSGNHAVVIKGGKVVHDPSWGGKRSEYFPIVDANAYGFLIFGALL